MAEKVIRGCSKSWLGTMRVSCSSRGPSVLDTCTSSSRWRHRPPPNERSNATGTRIEGRPNPRPGAFFAGLAKTERRDSRDIVLADYATEPDMAQGLDQHSPRRTINPPCA